MNSWFILADGPGFTSLFSSTTTVFWSAILRISEATVNAAPFLVAGVLTAGIMRGMIGPERLRKILAVGHWSGPFRAWGLGILLPICSLGALPVARELRRSGVPGGTVLSFVLVAPVLNPVSIIYGLSHIEPVTLIYFAVGTFVVSVGVGLIWNRFISPETDTVKDIEYGIPSSSLKRILLVGHTAARSLVGPAMIDYGLALLAVGLLGALIPYGILQTGLTRDNLLSPVIMGLVAIPVYVTPTEVMMHFGHIVKDGYSLGAAFSLIILGAGANVGVANWVRKEYGKKALALFVAMLIGSTIIIGITADRTIPAGFANQEDHTHAFDSFTRLSNVSSQQASFLWVWSQITKSIRTDEIVGLALMFVIAIAGITLKLLNKRYHFEQLLSVQSSLQSSTSNSGFNKSLTPKQLVFVMFCCIASTATVGLYIYYPSVDNLFDDMNMINVEAYSSIREEDIPEAKRRLSQWKLHAEKLTTSNLIRTGTVSESQKESTKELLYTLKTLNRYLNENRTEEAKLLLIHVRKIYRSCKSAFSNNKKNLIVTD